MRSRQATEAFLERSPQWWAAHGYPPDTVQYRFVTRLIPMGAVELARMGELTAHELARLRAVAATGKPDVVNGRQAQRILAEVRHGAD